MSCRDFWFSRQYQNENLAETKFFSNFARAGKFCRTDANGLIVNKCVIGVSANLIISVFNYKLKQLW